jgi:hypothetical protein
VAAQRQPRRVKVQRTALSGNANLELDDPSRDDLARDDELGYRNGKLEAAWPSATGIHVENAVAVLD